MIEYIFSLPCDIQVIIATCLTWVITAIGASIVLFFSRLNKIILDVMLSLASGIMIAASFWSLLSPAIDLAINLEMQAWLIVGIGFFSGGILIFVGNLFLDNFYAKRENCQSLKRKILLVFSITLHNIPEGLAIGVAFGSVAYGINSVSLLSAWLLAIGIGIQNFPEGIAVSAPLLREGYSKKRSFFFGQLSGLVEPISGFIGFLLVTKIRAILPFLLSLAAGAMIYVVIDELLPEIITNKKKSLLTLILLSGFVIMMILDVALS